MILATVRYLIEDKISLARSGDGFDMRLIIAFLAMA